MGSIYRRTSTICVTCKRRLLTSAEQAACTAAKHKIRERQSKIWYVKYKSGGKFVIESSKSEDRVDAERKLRDLETAVDKGAQPGRLTFDEAVAKVIEDYEIRERRSVDLLKSRIEKHLRPVFGGMQMTAITPERWTTYVAARKKAGAKNGTINREAAIVSRAFRLAMMHGRLLVKPYITKLPEAEPRQGFFTDEEFLGIRDALPAYMRPVASFLKATGWRVREALGLTWEQIDGEFVHLEPGRSKNKKGRKFPITEDVAKAIGKVKKSGPVFPDPATGEPIEFWSWRYGWDAARKAAGFPTRLAHDLRRTAVRAFTRAGIPDLVAMQLTGHKTRRVFDAYNIGADADLNAARERLDRLGAPHGAPKKPRRQRTQKR